MAPSGHYRRETPGRRKKPEPTVGMKEPNVARRPPAKGTWAALPVHLPARSSVAPVEASARCGEHSRLSGAPPRAHTRTIIGLAGSHPELASSELQYAL